MRNLCLLLATLVVLVLPARAGPDFSAADEKVGPVRLGMTASQLRTALGRPASQTSWVEEAATGKQVQDWRYPARGFAVTMSRDSSGETPQVERFTVKAPSKDATSRGIRIGDRADKVKKAYAGLLGSESTSSTLVVGSIYDGVLFTIRVGKVTEIFVGAAAE